MHRPPACKKSSLPYWLAALLAAWVAHAQASPQVEAPLADGITFRCERFALQRVERDMGKLLDDLLIDRKLVEVRKDAWTTSITYTLATPANDTSTLDFMHRPDYWVTESAVRIAGPNARPRLRHTVSQKEILLALMQHGRATLLSDRACDVKVLEEHLKLRQHIVAHAENLEFQWPDGEKARWNPAYWHRNPAVQPARLYAALGDMFAHPQRYSIGCYSAAKATYAFAIPDFYHQQKDQRLRDRILRRLAHGASPFSGIEPEAMWSFEEDFDTSKRDRPGKLLKLAHKVAPKNFVPGDWVYIYNNDAGSHSKVGYEGSNSIYLGRGLFVDFYNDAAHKYTFEQKLAEVFQWRHGVFSQSRDYRKSAPLSGKQLELLSLSPASGGLVSDVRAVPYFFGHEDLPELDAPRLQTASFRASTPAPDVRPVLVSIR